MLLLEGPIQRTGGANDIGHHPVVSGRKLADVWLSITTGGFDRNFRQEFQSPEALQP
jgi:hypothetical protein